MPEAGRPPNFPVVIHANVTNAHELKELMAAYAEMVYEHTPRMASDFMPPDCYGTPYEATQLGNTWDSKEELRRHGSYCMYITAMSKLAMRMQWGPYAPRDVQGITASIPFDHMSIHEGSSKAFIFIVHGSEAITLEDDMVLFPSDKLCTQIRMLLEAGK